MKPLILTIAIIAAIFILVFAPAFLAFPGFRAWVTTAFTGDTKSVETTDAADAPVDTAPAAEPAAPEEATETEPVDSDPVDTAVKKNKAYGTVMESGSSTPVAGARVFLAKLKNTRHSDLPLAEENTGPETVTDNMGVYEFDFEPNGWNLLCCVAPGHARASQNITMSDASDVRMDFFLLPGATISGRVADSRTGQGVDGVAVNVAPSGQNLVEALTDIELIDTTEKGGLYELAGVSLGSHRVFVRGRDQGYLFRPESAVTLNIEPGRDYSGVDIKVDPAAIAKGSVVNQSGNPVAKARVTAFPARMLENVMGSMDRQDHSLFADLRCSSDDNGHFELKGLAPGMEYRLKASAEGYADTDTEPFTAPEAGVPSEHKITMQPGSRVSGTAYLPDGQPAKEHVLHLSPDFSSIVSGSFSNPKQTTTDQNGKFVFETVPAGVFILAGTKAVPLDDGSGISVETDGLNPVEGLKLTLADAPESTKISGIVLAPDGKPAGGVRVEAKQAMNPMSTSGSSTDDQGAFTIDTDANMPYDLSVTDDIGVGEAKNVMPGAPVTIQLSPPIRVSGYVFAASKEPAVACNLILVKAEQNENANPMAIAMQSVIGEQGKKATADQTGYFEFANVAPGSYKVKAKSQNLGTGETDPFDLDGSGDLTGLNITLDPGVRFAGKTVDAQNNPVAGVAIQLVAESANPMEAMMRSAMPSGMQHADASTTSGPDGSFEMAQVPPGSYSINATHASFARYRATSLILEPGKDTTGYVIAMQVGGQAEGLYLENGEPVAGAMITMMGESGMQMATTGADGKFNLSAIPEGSYILNAMHPGMMSGGVLSGGYAMKPRVVEIVNGQMTQIDLGDDTGVPVSGVVSGVPEGNITSISLRRPGGPEPGDIQPNVIADAIEATRYAVGQCMTAADGSFSIPGVDPGSYILEVYSFKMDLKNPDMNAIQEEARRPRIREEIAVNDEPVSLMLSIPQ